MWCNYVEAPNTRKHFRAERHSGLLGHMDVLIRRPLVQDQCHQLHLTNAGGSSHKAQLSKPQHLFFSPELHSY